MGYYFEANLDSKLRSKAVGKVRFQTITPAADLDTMAEPIITEDATTVYTTPSDTPEDLTGASSDSSDPYSSHEETEEISLPISRNPEPIAEPEPQTQGFSQLGPSDTPYESTSDPETVYQPPSSSPWPLTFDDDTIDQWLAKQLATQAPRHIDMNETFEDNALFHQSLGYGGNTTH